MRMVKSDVVVQPGMSIVGVRPLFNMNVLPAVGVSSKEPFTTTGEACAAHASNDSVVQLIRMFLELAFDKKVTFIEITAIADGKKDSISIST